MKPSSLFTFSTLSKPLGTFPGVYLPLALFYVIFLDDLIPSPAISTAQELLTLHEPVTAAPAFPHSGLERPTVCGLDTSPQQLNSPFSFQAYFFLLPVCVGDITVNPLTKQKNVRVILDSFSHLMSVVLVKFSSFPLPLPQHSNTSGSLFL